MKKSHVTLTTLLLLSLLAVGCKTIFLKDSWKDPNYDGPTFSKYLVISLASATGNRIIIEDNFVRELKAKGANAVASYKVLPPDGTVNRDVIKAAIEGKDYDAVIIGRLTAVDVHKAAIIPQTAGAGVGLYDYTEYNWYQPGRDYNTYKVESTVWQVSSEKLVWKSEYDVLDPRNIPKETEKLAKEIVKQLRKFKLV